MTSTGVRERQLSLKKLTNTKPSRAPVARALKNTWRTEMNLTNQQRNILIALASSSRKLHYFTHERDTVVFKLTLTKMVNNGLIFEEGDNYHISTKGRQAVDAPGVGTKTLINDWRKGVYKTGDGDIITAKRPGSMDAFSLPSKR
jgi:hypothetical protein